MQEPDAESRRLLVLEHGEEEIPHRGNHHCSWLPALLLGALATAAVLHWARWIGKPVSTDRRQAIKRFSISSIPSSEHDVVCYGDENEHCHRSLVHCLGNTRLQEAVAECEAACDVVNGHDGVGVDTLETCLRLFPGKAAGSESLSFENRGDKSGAISSRIAGLGHRNGLFAG